MTPRQCFSQIIDEVAAKRGLHRRDILSRHREKPIAQARQEAMTSVRDRLGWSYARIARAIGLDESSVRQGVKTFRERQAGDTRVAAGLPREWNYGQERKENKSIVQRSAESVKRAEKWDRFEPSKIVVAGRKSLGGVPRRHQPEPVLAHRTSFNAER